MDSSSSSSRVNTIGERSGELSGVEGREKARRAGVVAAFGIRKGGRKLLGLTESGVKGESGAQTADPG